MARLHFLFRHDLQLGLAHVQRLFDDPARRESLVARECGAEHADEQAAPRDLRSERRVHPSLELDAHGVVAEEKWLLGGVCDVMIACRNSTQLNSTQLNSTLQTCLLIEAQHGRAQELFAVLGVVLVALFYESVRDLLEPIIVMAYIVMAYILL